MHFMLFDTHQVQKLREGWVVIKQEKYKTVGKNKDMFYENSYKNNATNFGWRFKD